MNLKYTFITENEVYNPVYMSIQTCLTRRQIHNEK